MELDLDESTNFYSLGRKNGEIGFYKFKNGENTTITLGANKAYLETEALNTSPSRGFTFGFVDPSSVLSPLSSFLSPLSSAVYNLQGRKMDALHKGVNIVRKSDGSVVKVIVK